jgi:hypothetical protein
MEVGNVGAPQYLTQRVNGQPQKNRYFGDAGVYSAFDSGGLAAPIEDDAACDVSIL